MNQARYSSHAARKNTRPPKSRQSVYIVGMARYVIDLQIPKDQLMRYYRGSARGVITTARSGQRVRFPAQALRQFVAHNGVNGVFALDVDGANRLRNIQRLGPS